MVTLAAFFFKCTAPKEDAIFFGAEDGSCLLKKTEADKFERLDMPDE